MSKDVEIAVAALVNQLGSETAHLDIEDQITVAIRMARECNNMASSLMKERGSDSAGEKS